MGEDRPAFAQLSATTSARLPAPEAVVLEHVPSRTLGAYEAGFPNRQLCGLGLAAMGVASYPYGKGADRARAAIRHAVLPGHRLRNHDCR